MNPPKIDHLVRSKRKTVALVIRPDASLEVRAPTRLPLTAIQQFIQEKTPWILKHQEQVRAGLSAARGRQYASGETFLYLGQEYSLVVTAGKRAGLRFKDGIFYLTSAGPQQAEDLFTQWYRRQARQVLELRTTSWASQLNIQYSAIRITSARTRWGSHSSKGTICYTWRLVMAPVEVIDYVIVHELMHARQPNHSQKFWDLVAAVLPDYRQRRKWLKTNGHLLDLAVTPAAAR